MGFPTLLAAASPAAPSAPSGPAACNEHHSNLCEVGWDLFHATGLAQTLDDISTPVNVIGILILGWIAQRVVRRLIKRSVKGLQGEVVQRRLSSIRRRTPKAFLNTGESVTLRRAQRAETIGSLLRSASTTIIFLITFFAALSQLSLDVKPFVTGTAILTAALAFGAQNIVRDFLAGFFIVVEDQYGVGDIIDLGTTSGTVEAVSLRITRIRGADGTLWHVPNGEIKRVGNKSQTWSRAVVEFRVNLDTDIPKAIKIVKHEADEMWRDSDFAGVITAEPEIWAPDEIDSDGILIKVAIKTLPREQWHIQRVLRTKIKAAFDKEGVRIASSLADAYGTPQIEEGKATA